ncbi:Beta-3 adrenergic receptor [Trichoplax sp. H2]|nr:Beta-3 adrenergic receptor [Trichoplax sp. H2]|eukprot:RDD46712.1 Beta-3 adrenergic receptor [Trichoplax sp. H2]
MDNTTSPLSSNLTVTSDVYILRYVTLPIIMFFSIFGNLLVCMVTYSKLQNVTNIMIFNLALADLIVGIVIIPAVLSSTIIGEWIGDATSCKVIGILNASILVVSVWMLVVISIIRYVLVAFPHRSHTLLTKRKAYAVVVLLWIWSFVSAATAELWSPYYYHPQIFDCWFDYSIPFKHQFLMILINILLPLSIMIFAYIKIYLILRKQYRSFQNHIPRTRSMVIRVAMKVGSSVVVPMLNKKSQRSPSQDALGNRLPLARLKDDAKVTRMMFIVLLAFLLAWSPGAFILQFFFFIQPVSPFILNLVFIIGYSNSAINCFIYGFLNKTFRHSFERILTCHKCRKSTNSSF